VTVTNGNHNRMNRPTLYLFALLMMFSPLRSLDVRADGSGQLLSQERVIEDLERYVLEHSAWRADQVEVVLRTFSSLSLPAGEIATDILKPNRGVTPGIHRFLLSVRVNGREEARTWIDSDIRVFDEVVVASQPLAHFESLTPEKVRLERRNLGELPPQPLTSLADIEGKQMARPVEVNQVLTTSMLDLPRIVRRGSVVSLVYESVGLHVELSGRAAEPGRVGDRIRVENPSSGKVVEGQILDDRTVKVN
jgi:flagellar basal body P-ring formation protein FlgA